MIYLSEDKARGVDCSNGEIIRSFGFANVMACDPEGLIETEKLIPAQEEPGVLPWTEFNLQGLRKTSGLNQKDFAKYYEIPVRTLQEWEQGRRTPPEYVVKMMFRIWINEH